MNDTVISRERLQAQLNAAYMQGSADAHAAQRFLQPMQAQDAANWRALRELCGYVQNSSDTTVRIFQDDATHSFHIVCGVLDAFSRPPRKYYGSTLGEALSEATKGEATLT